LIEKEALDFKDSEHVEMEKDCPPALRLLHGKPRLVGRITASGEIAKNVQ